MSIFDMHKPKRHDRENSKIHSVERRQWFHEVFSPELQKRLKEKDISASFRIVGSVMDNTAGEESDIDVYMSKEKSNSIEFELIFPLARQIVNNMHEEGYCKYTVQLWNSLDIPLQAHKMFHEY